MNYPDFKEEKRLHKKGYDVVAGIDEVGRGPLAGPVVACAFCLKWKGSMDSRFKRVRDSKQLSAKEREEIFNLLKRAPGAQWGIGRVSEKTIDRINIFEATKLAMKKAVENLKEKPGFLLIDGNFGINVDAPQKPIVKGDQKVFSIAAASIMAKVTRDRIMARYHKKYPEYSFDRHKGYPTELHRIAINKHGLCRIHRKTFHIS